MRDIEKKILKSLEDDIKILKRANTKTNEIKDHIRDFRDFSNDNTEEYKKEKENYTVNIINRFLNNYPYALEIYDNYRE